MPSSTRVGDDSLPSLISLGHDLLKTTDFQRRLGLLRPFVGIAAYCLAAYAGVWWLTPIIVFFIFVAIVTVTHDVVHETIGLSRTQTEWALFIMGAILLESGHAYRTTHIQHHRLFPHHEDPEGDPARMSFFGAALHGIIFLPRLWLWALRKNVGQRDQQYWLIAEALWMFSFVVTGILFWQQHPAILAYAALAIAGSWVYPLLTVHLPHRGYGETPLTQTHTLRGWLIPKLFLELTYHLEHHLYPQVPSHNLNKLSRRLDPFFQRARVVPRRVP